MELVLHADPAVRGCLLREARAFCAGCAYDPLVVENVAGADTATLVLSLRSPSGTVLARSTPFSAVPGRPASRQATLSLATAPMREWCLSFFGESESDAGAAPLSAMARLELSDASSVWAFCDVPVLLRIPDDCELGPAGWRSTGFIDPSALPGSADLRTVAGLFSAVEALARAVGANVVTEDTP